MMGILIPHFCFLLKGHFTNEFDHVFVYIFQHFVVEFVCVYMLTYCGNHLIVNDISLCLVWSKLSTLSTSSWILMMSCIGNFFYWCDRVYSSTLKTRSSLVS